MHTASTLALAHQPPPPPPLHPVLLLPRPNQNQRVGPFDAARLILGPSRTPLRDRYELFFTDYSLLPLLVHQNYLSSLMNLAPKVRTDVTAAASAAVSDADIISGKMR